MRSPTASPAGPSLPLALLWCAMGGTLFGGCAAATRTVRDGPRLSRCLRAQGALEARLRLLGARLSRVEGVAERSAALAAAQQRRVRELATRLRAAQGRLRWFRGAACRDVGLRLQDAIFQGRLQQVRLERLRGRLTRTRATAVRRALSVRREVARRRTRTSRGRLRRLRELARRCRLMAAARALRPPPGSPPPPAPGPPGERVSRGARR